MAGFGGDKTWIAVQQNTFTNWCNSNLKRTGEKIENLVTDLDDGVKLVVLLEQLSKKKVSSKIHYKPRIPAHRTENLQMAFDFMKNKEKIHMVNIEPRDIQEHNQKIILGLIWHLILKYQILTSQPEPTVDDSKPWPRIKVKPPSAKRFLMNWLRAAMPEDCEVKNVTSSWNDGKNLSALVNTMKPGLCPNYASLSPSDALPNTKKAMDQAEEEFDIPQIIDPKHLCMDKPDELSCMTYLSYFCSGDDSPGYNSLLEWVRSKIPDYNIENFTDDWRDGCALSALVNTIAEGTVPNHAELDPSKGVDNIRSAMETADDNLDGIENNITPEEFADKRTDALAMMGYIEWFRKARPKQRESLPVVELGIEATVQHSYRAEKEDELDLEEGDIVQVFESRKDGWLRGMKQKRSGWFPGSHIKGCTQATVQHSYHAEEDDELDLEEGDVIQVLAKGKDGRWRGVNRERTGWFPGTCVKEMEQSKELKKALEFQKNLEDVLMTSASVTLKITKCTTIGPPEVGKTHLKCLLLGQEWDPNTGRTDVIRAPEWVEHYIEDSSTWKLFTHDERMQAIIRNIMNKKYQENKKDSQEKKEDHHEEKKDNNQEKDEQEVKAKSVRKKHKIKPSLQRLNEEEKVNSSEQADVNVIEDPSIHALDTSLGHILEGSHLSDSELEGHILGEKRLLYFVDTGGQEYYHDIHPILITSPSVYFVVFDLMKCLEEGGGAKFFREELIQRPLRSIHAFGTKQVRQSKFLKIHPSDPKIFIIGTHLDQVRKAGKEKEIESVSSDVQSELLTKPYKKFLQPDPSDLAFWPIDNTLAGKPLDEDSEDSEYICDLKSEAVEGVYDAEVTVPLSWLILEQTMKTVPEADFFPYHQLFDLCSKKELVHSEEEFQTMLYIFHILGLFFFPPILKDAPLRDDEVVYTNPDYLYKMTSKLLKECRFRESPIAKETCPRQGIIQDYRKLLSNIGVKENMREIFLNMLQDLKIIVKIKSKDLILFPAALPATDQVSRSEAPSSPGPLLLSFTSSRLLKVCYIPTGFFRLLIADLAANPTWTLDLDKLSHNFVTFDVGTGELGLLERVSFIEVTFTPSDDSLPSSSSSYNAMYQQLKERVLSLWSNVYGQKDESSEQWIQWGFPCESHPEESHTHIAKLIGDEDDYIASCLHPMGRRIQSVREEQILWLFPH